ncbi:MAG: alpha/beta fold hydrolase [Planctomycetes bacterium]|nr:alpha/beta fold hydrolase [Planctomycetota bacterium]
MSADAPDAAVPAPDTPFRRLLVERGWQRYAMVEGRRISYAEAGAGRPVFLLHGLGGSAYDWRHSLAFLARRRFRAIAVELLGAGFSEKPADDDYSVQAQAERLAGLADALGIKRVSLVGNSLGGTVALAFAQAHPRRTQSLVLIDPACFRERLPFYLRLARIRLLPEVGIRLIPDRALVYAIMRGLYGDASKMESDAVDEYLAELRRPGRKSTLLEIIRHLLEDDPTHFERGIAAVKAPTLVLWGEKDRLLPVAHAARLAAAIAGAHLRVYPGVGHILNQEIHDRFNRLTSRFLRYVARRPATVAAKRRARAAFEAAAGRE